MGFSLMVLVNQESGLKRKMAAKCRHKRCTSRRGEADRVIERYVRTAQLVYLESKDDLNLNECAEVKSRLEHMHREVVAQSPCAVCRDEFKRRKFYLLDEAGFEFSADGILERRTGIMI